MSVTFSAEHAPEALQVNMSNTNAARVCETLAIDLAEQGWAGDMPAEAFLGRILLALALAPTDDGMPSYERTIVGTGPRIIEGARKPGYLQKRLTQLHALAQYAVQQQTEVWWA